MPDGTDKIPKVIGIRTEEFLPLVERWQKDHECVPWSVLLRRALKKELKQYAGKRYAHIVSEAA